MAYFVFNGAKLECTMGDMESYLEVLDPKGEGFLCGDKAANVADCKPLINIQPFGQCQSLLNPSVQAATTANYGRLQPMPCMVPNIVEDKWENWAESNMYIRGNPVLLNCATLNCVYQGSIAITEDIREGVKTGALGLDKDVMDDSDFVDHNIGPGTQYINNKGQLLYQRMDGASGRIFIVLDNNISGLEIMLRMAKRMGTLNDPDNNNLLIGMTGKEYTKRHKYSPDTNFESGYQIGYSGDTNGVMRLRRNAAGAAFSDANYGSDAMESAWFEKVGANCGLDDWEKKLIDLYNPTARITGPALITI